MRYAVISDVHANLEALRQVLDDAAACGAESVVCLGDVVGYGPLPVETVVRVREACALVLAGNHDDAVSGRGDASAFNGLAADAVTRHREALSAADLDWLKALPYVGELDGAILAHGDFVDPEKFYYVDDAEGAAANFAATDAQLMFVGHTHTPALAVVGDSGTAHVAPAQDFTLEPNKRYIVNPGSVGYPRETNGVCLSSYVVYDSAAKTVEFRYLPFSVSSVMPRGRATARRRRAILACVALGAAAAAAAAVFFAKPATRTVTKTETKVVEVEKAEDPALVLATRERALRPGDKKVRANLKVEDGPVELMIEFRDAGGRRVGDVFRRTIKSSYKTAHAVPDGACAAVFTVRKPTREASPRVTQLDPTTLRP
jgi:predicted phosphodiesterase